MAARAVWQRSANRYFVQQDAKRAPKLACCPSTSSLLSKSDTKPSVDFDDKSLESYPLSDSKWWLQMQPNSHQFVENQGGSSISTLSNKSYEFVGMDSVDRPWWQMVGLKKSNNLSEKYDLPKPTHAGSVSKPQVIKCSQSAVSQVGMENFTRTPICEIDSSKSKLLEALCHSQTRARKAQIAAKEAYEEKEHAIKLLVWQASQLFAYRQWIYEILCYQNSTPSKNGKLHNRLDKVTSAKGKRRRTRRGVERYDHDIGKYAVVFVVGLGIVGAGLLLGWTVGWMLI